MASVFLSLGSNLGDRKLNLVKGLRSLTDFAAVQKVSSLYETAPWGRADQPDFLNLAAMISTTLEPPQLLTRVKSIESAVGRRPGPRWGARILDIDILLYGNTMVSLPDLTIPHPLLHQRAFVLIPLLELWPEAVLPDGKPLRTHLPALEHQTVMPRGPMFWEDKPMYTVSIRKHFDAAHYLRDYHGRCENLHGHRYEVALTVESADLADNGMAYDFTELKKQLTEKVLDRYDHACLNDLPDFQSVNPSAENIARLIYEQMQPVVQSPKVALKCVTVWESPDSWATYTM